MHLKKNNLKKGFTLVEIMLSVVILSILGITSGAFLVQTRKKSHQAEVRLQTALTANTMMSLYARPQTINDTLTVNTATSDGRMNFQSEITYTKKTEELTNTVSGTLYTFPYFDMECQTTSIECPTVSVTLKTILEKSE